MGTPQTAQNIPLGLPYEGMDLQTPLSALPITRAPFIENLSIDGQSMAVRAPAQKFSQISGSNTGDYIFALGQYVSSSGTESLFGVKNLAGSKEIWNFSTTVATFIKTTTLSVDTFFLQSRSNLYLMDGSGTPQGFDGTDWAAFGAAFATSGLTCGFTGPGSVNNFKCGTVYKNRVYLIENNTTKVWYGGVDAVNGAMTSFDVGSLLTKGGKLYHVTTVNYGQNNAAAAYICLVTDQGEVLTYQGSYPGSPTFELVARFETGKPLSRRGFVTYQGDTLMMTETGIVSLRDLIGYALQSNGRVYKTYSSRVDPLYKLTVQSLRNSGITDMNGFVSATYCKRTSNIYVMFAYSPVRVNNKLDATAVNGAFCFVYNTLSDAWYTYKYFTTNSTLVSCVTTFGEKLVCGLYLSGLVFELEKPGTFRDENPDSLGTYQAITGNILSACLSSTRDSGNRQKFNSLNLYAYLNAGSASNPVECYLVENFGKVTGTTKPTIIEDDFNSLPLNVGSSREYVQYSLTVKTNSSTGDPTVLYNLNALMEQGGYR